MPIEGQGRRHCDESAVLAFPRISRLDYWSHKGRKGLKAVSYHREHERCLVHRGVSAYSEKYNLAWSDRLRNGYGICGAEGYSGFGSRQS